MKKGTWYYEIQILMFVIMWQHDMTHKNQSTYGLKIKRLYIWRDTAWLRHGFGYKLMKFWKLIIHYPLLLIRFIRSLVS